MYEDQLQLLVCPKTKTPLFFVGALERAADGEVLTGTLRSEAGTEFSVTSGIPRFVRDMSYNPTWDVKWRVIDRGRGLNYRIIDKSDPAYQIHDLFDRNGYGGLVYERARGRRAVDLGCGVGQYSVRLAREFEPESVVAVDLTTGVDVFRKVLDERYPELRRRILIVQADIFELPLADAAFDFVMSLGVLMHTGDTLRALGRALDLVRTGGHVDFWIYGSEPVAYAVSESNRGFVYNMDTIVEVQRRFRRVQRWIRLFRRVPDRHHRHVVAFLRWISSDPVFHALQRPRLRFLYQWFPTVVHPDADYRWINNYDGYVNRWSDSWSEKEIFPLLRERGFVVRDLAEWRLGFWAVKDPGFYERTC